MSDIVMNFIDDRTLRISQLRVPDLNTATVINYIISVGKYQTMEHRWKILLAYRPLMSPGSPFLTTASEDCYQLPLIEEMEQ
jgi:hypothetical protein